MRLTEFSKLKEEGNPHYDPSQDEGNRREYGDLRKPKLTLRHINKLRKMREAKKLDMIEREKFWAAMYGNPPEEMEGGVPEF